MTTQTAKIVKRKVLLKRIYDETVFFVKEGESIVDFVIDQRTWNQMGGPIKLVLTIQADEED